MSTSKSDAISMLKYFYSINLEELCDRIRSELNPSSPLDEKIDTVFNYIYDATANYTEYIAGTNEVSATSFFGEARSSKYLTGLSQLLYVSLKNNCIIHSYLSALHQTSEPVEIRAKNERLLCNGYYATTKSTLNSSPSLKGATNSAVYYSYLTRVRKDCSLYSNAILKTINPNIMKPSAIFTAPNYLAGVCNFLLCKNEVASFNRALKKTDNVSVTKNNRALIQRYNKLYDVYKEAFIPASSETELPERKNASSKITLSDDRDKFLHSLELNAMYGFDVIQDIYTFLSEVKAMPLSTIQGTTIQSARDLDGKVLLSILNQVCNLPLYYNKFIFFKYALTAVINNHSFNSAYLNQIAKEAMRVTDQITSFSDSVSRAYILMKQYFLILSHVTIPLLYTLCDTILPSIFTSDSSETISDKAKIEYCNLIGNYIASNNKVFTASFSDLDKPTISELTYIFYQSGTTQFAMHKAINERIDTLKKPIDTFPLILSTNTNQEVAYIIRSYCTQESLFQYRFPFFNLSKDDYYIPIQALIESTIPPLRLGNNSRLSDSLALEDLNIEHLGTLQKYVSSLRIDW